MSNKNSVYALLIGGLLAFHSSYAGEGEFITIIGPDGLPMVVPYPKQSKKNKPLKPSKLESKEKTYVENKAPETTFPNKKSKASKKDVNAEAVVPMKAEKNITPSTAPQLEPNPKNVAQELEGETYYNSDYLESKEFNLEGKTRFYQIPVGENQVTNASTWNVIERQKGADMSWFRQRDQQKNTSEPIALGKYYTVIAKEELLSALPKQCLTDKEMKKAKKIGKDNTASMFPRAPFQDQFDFDLVMLSSGTKDVRIHSFLNGSKNQTYYWPLAVFLNEKGCILEGASAFYSDRYPSTPLQSESITGVIHIPQFTKYMMLTPLESAADLPEMRLSNQGQIKLTVLR